MIASLGSPRAESGARAESPAGLPAMREPGASAKHVFWRTSISIGMSDDEVLNLPT